MIKGLFLGVKYMDLYKELVDGSGYKVCSIENMQIFKKYD